MTSKDAIRIAALEFAKRVKDQPPVLWLPQAMYEEVFGVTLTDPDEVVYGTAQWGDVLALLMCQPSKGLTELGIAIYEQPVAIVPKDWQT